MWCAVTFNARSSWGSDNVIEDINTIITNSPLRPVVIALQEMGSDDAATKVSHAFQSRGYYLIQNNNAKADPILFDTATHKMIGEFTWFLTPRTYSPEGAGPETLKKKEAQVLILKNKSTGHVKVFVNSHLAPSLYLALRSRLHRHQVRRLAKCIKYLKKSYPHGSVVVLGDFNTKKKKRMNPLLRLGLFTRVTGITFPSKRTKLDWIISNDRPVGTQVIDHLHSDHNAYLMRFRGR